MSDPVRNSAACVGVANVDNHHQMMSVDYSYNGNIDNSQQQQQQPQQFPYQLQSQQQPQNIGCSSTSSEHMTMDSHASAVVATAAAVAAAEEHNRQKIFDGGRHWTPDAINKYQAKHEMFATYDGKPFVDIHQELLNTLAMEPKYQPCLYLPEESQLGEITTGARNGATHVLRCLKVWYDLPTDILFAAINLVDRFLTKMKVKPKHLACISVGSFHLAIEQLGVAVEPIDTDHLVAISQCRCTAGDVKRMAGIINDKLGVQKDVAPITALSFLRLFHYIYRYSAANVGLLSLYDDTMKLENMEMKLEILACDAECASIRPSELAMVLISCELGLHESNDHILNPFFNALKNECRIPGHAFNNTYNVVDNLLSRYYGQHKMPYRQRLVWKLSSRTMRVLRPLDKLNSCLPTIAEHSAKRLRLGSDSSEEGEDWPTSPFIPVYEQC